MSDYACIIDHLKEAEACFEKDDFLNAAINAYWCMKYCEHGNPWEMSGVAINEADAKANKILKSSSKHIKKSLLSKTTFIYGTICPKLLWLYKNKYDFRKISDNTQKKFDAGHIIGSLAQKLFKDGIDASNVDDSRVIDMSPFKLPFYLKQPLWLNKTFAHHKDKTVYEAAFIHDDVFAAVDILTPAQTGNIAYEVKCSGAISETLLRDCALQYYVISHNCNLEDFFLVYVDENYVRDLGISYEEMNEGNTDINKLFIKESVLSRILPIQQDIKNSVKLFKSILKGHMPKVECGEHCHHPYECMYNNYCNPVDPPEFGIW